MTSKKTAKNSNGEPGVRRKAKKVTLSDVAKVADVSTMTVSKVIRKTGSISKPTQDKVYAAIDQLGYVPNQLAGSLSSQVNLMVAVIVPSLGNRVFADVLLGIDDVLNGAGMHTFVGQSNFHTDIEEEIIRTMMSWQPSGLILTGGISHSLSAQRILAAQSCPIVQIWDNDEPDFDVNVGFSHELSGQIMANHFKERKFQKVGYVGAEHDIDVCAARRFDGFRKQMEVYGTQVASEIVPNGERQTPDGIVGTERLLKRVPDLDAIFYLNDAMAVGGLTHLHRIGKRVPKDIAVAGFNGSSRGQLIHTDLTTIDVPRREIGEFAARSLLDKVAGKSVPRKMDFQINLIQGSTT